MGQPESKLGGSKSDPSSQIPPSSPNDHPPTSPFPPASPSPAFAYPGSPYTPSSPFTNSPYPASSLYPSSPYVPNSPFPATAYPPSPAFNFTPQSPGGPQVIMPIPVDGVIPYTNYSIEKTPEKQDKSKRPSPPSQPTFVDDPLLDKFKRCPSFLPILSNKKLVFDDMDTKGMQAILIGFEQYLISQADHTKREHERMNDSIRQMLLACMKAQSLASQHSIQLQKFASSMPAIDQMTAQVIQTQSTLNKVVSTISLIEAAFDARELAITATPSPSLSSSTSSLTSSTSSLTEESFNPTRPPRPRNRKASSIESPYLTAKPRGATPRKPTIEGAPPPSPSPPAESALEVWTCRIIPQWDEIKARESPWVRSMWKTGIPKSVRGQVWRLAIGNHLGLTRDIFNTLLEGSSETDTTRAIEVDISRTFAHVDVGDPEVFRNNLMRVLKAYSKHKSDIGYVQGMSYIAGMLLQYMDDYESFVCMTNLLENAFLKGLFRLDTVAIEQYVTIFGSLLNQIEPKLDKHFSDIFSKSLPLEICGKVWDCFLLEGEIFAFVASLGILRLYRKSLKRMDMEECKKMLSNLPIDIPEEELFTSIESIPAPLYNSLLEKIHQKIS